MKENRTEETKIEVEEKEKDIAAQVLVIKERKIDLQAKNEFEIYQLQHTSDHFLSCEITEEIEFFEFTYSIANQTPISQLDPKDWNSRLSTLIQIQQLLIKETSYHIAMKPDNFYMDEQGIVRILKRDLQKSDPIEGQELKAFQALSGTLLQTKYSYDELFSGGVELLKENDRTKSITEWTNLTEARDDLLEKQREFKIYQNNNNITVRKTRNLSMKIALLVFSVATVIVSALYIYQTFWLIPPQESALASERAFIEKDYVNVIDSLSGMEVDTIAKAEKYILAVSYVRSQSIDTFSNEAKELILSKIVPTGTEIIMDYWIYLGRLDATSAAEIAMSLSDNQLLLYAYLQEMDNVSRDNQLEGTKKAEKLNDLEGKIKGLADKLGIEYDEEIQQNDVKEMNGNKITTTTSDSKESEKTKETSSSKKE